MAKNQPIRPYPFVEVDGPLATYCACFTGLNVGTGVTSAIASIQGVTGKVIRVVQVAINGTVSTAAAHFDVVVATYANASVITAGTPQVLTAVPQDPNDVASVVGAASKANAWTAAPTLAGLVGNSASSKLFCPTPGSALNTGVQFNFGFGAGAKAITLRNSNQLMAITLNGVTPANVSQLDGFIIWTEDDN